MQTRTLPGSLTRGRRRAGWVPQGPLMPFLSVFPTLQAEIVKRLNGICAQVLPYLSQEVTAWQGGVGVRERGPAHTDPGSSHPCPVGSALLKRFGPESEQAPRPCCPSVRPLGAAKAGLCVRAAPTTPSSAACSWVLEAMGSELGRRALKSTSMQLLWTELLCPTNCPG